MNKLNLPDNIVQLRHEKKFTQEEAELSKDFASLPFLEVMEKIRSLAH